MRSLEKIKAFVYWGLLLIMFFLLFVYFAIKLGAFSYFYDRKLISESESLYHHVQNAKLYAKKNNVPVKIYIKQGVKGCYGTSSIGYCNCSKLNSCNLGQSALTVNSGVAIYVVGSPVYKSSNSLTVLPSGIIMPPKSAIELRYRQHILKVETTRAGVVDICSVAEMRGYRQCNKEI